MCNPLLREMRKNELTSHYGSVALSRSMSKCHLCKWNLFLFSLLPFLYHASSLFAFFFLFFSETLQWRNCSVSLRGRMAGSNISWAPSNPLTGAHPATRKLSGNCHTIYLYDKPFHTLNRSRRGLPIFFSPFSSRRGHIFRKSNFVRSQFYKKKKRKMKQSIFFCFFFSKLNSVFHFNEISRIFDVKSI